MVLKKIVPWRKQPVRYRGFKKLKYKSTFIALNDDGLGAIDLPSHFHILLRVYVTRGGDAPWLRDFLF